MAILQWTNTTLVIYIYGTFLPFLSLVIFLSVLPNSFIALGLKSSWLPTLYLECNPILKFVDTYLNWWFISKCFMLLDHVFQRVLNIWYINNIYQVVQILHPMLLMTVSIQPFYTLPCVVDAKVCWCNTFITSS